MSKANPITIVLIILIIITGGLYVWLSPETFKKIKSINAEPTAITAIRSYAAGQFGVPEDKIKITNQNKQEWQDICLGIKIPNYKCTKTKTIGYEAVAEANGYQIKYRSSEDGKMIRVVK